MAGTPSPAPRRNKALLIAKIVGALVVVFIVLPGVFLYSLLAGSKPKLDGSVSAPGLGGAVTISRDSLGIPTVVAATREELAYGTGFAHGQDRFFQMDLSRRLAAGELSEIFGGMALEQDRRARLFRFRNAAQAVLAQASADQRAVIAAYARGVNAGLGSLRSRPWEYIALQVTPAEWRDEDVVLVSYAMWWDLQASALRREQLRRALNLRLGGAECANEWKCAMEFFYPRGTSWDSPNSTTGSVAPLSVRIPTPDELNLRAARTPTSSAPPASGAAGSGGVSGKGLTIGTLPAARRLRASSFPNVAPERAATVGSNGWALAGPLVEGGGALVASDMHLNLRVPAVWYRARLQLKPAGASAPTLDLNGLTLPGAPVLVAGSNGHIAWGFTNAYGDWTDVTLAPCTAVDDTTVRTSGESIPVTTVQEKIRVKGAKLDSILPVRTGPAGVLIEADPAAGRCWFARWIATVPAATNFDIMKLEAVTSVVQAVELAPSLGIPHQNLMLGDREGHIAWTVAGRIPDTTDSQKRLTGEAPWTTAANHPKVVDPPGGRVWTANARPTDDVTMESLIGGDEAPLGADYDLGARAKQIHDGLVAISSPAKPADMLAVQLDDRGLFLARWRDLLINLLDDEALHDHPRRSELKREVVDWNARATSDSVGYRLVRAYRNQTEDAVWRMLLTGLNVEAPEAPPPAQFEGSLWELVTQQPEHLLAADFANWRAFMLAQVDELLFALTGVPATADPPCPRIDRCTWGARRPVNVRHPMSGGLPLLAGLLNMESLELPGDHDMPRVQDGSFGASERFAVTPGRESEGYLHIAGGQSGHPLSPYYRAGFKEWAEGKPLPFLPGPAEHTLTLNPAP